MTTFKTYSIALLLTSLSLPCFGQTASEIEAAQTVEEAHTIILTPGHAKPPAFLYAASVRAEVRVGEKEIEQIIKLQLRIVQGDSNRGRDG